MRNWKSSALAVVALALNLVVADAASAQDFGYDTGGLNTYSIAPVVSWTDPGGLNAYSIVPEVSWTDPVTQNTDPNANVVMWDVDVVTGDSLFSSGNNVYTRTSGNYRYETTRSIESWEFDGDLYTVLVAYDTVVYQIPFGIDIDIQHYIDVITYDVLSDPLFYDPSDMAPATTPLLDISNMVPTPRSDPLNDIADVATNIDDWPLPNDPAIASSIDNLSDDEDNASVPEPSLIIGTMLALAAGIKVLKRGHEQ